MVQPNRRYVVDTGLYVDALRTEVGRQALKAFRNGFAPFEYLNAVVVHELRAGVRGREAALLDDSFVKPLERRGRLVTPSFNAWKEAGRVLSELFAPHAWREVRRSFVNDVLLAMSCRESGLTLVTNNVRDFARIAQVRPFDFVPAWPIPTN